MDLEIQTIIDSLPSKPHRSRLGPYEELIRVMRSRGWTYRAIAKRLFEDCGLRVSPSNIHHYLKAQSLKEEQGGKPQRSSEQTQPIHGAEGRAVKTAEVYERIAAFKKRIPQRDAPERKFEFDPDQPLRLNSVAEARKK